MNKWILLGGACLSSFIATVAAAQVQVTQPAQETSEVDEVVVTAQRREERLIDVPISISTQSGEQLESRGIKTINDLSIVTPGLKIDQTGAGFTVPALRGVSTGVTGVGEDPNVAIYVDGIYQPNAIANNFSFADLQRVEVAKGPQGTLFGRNATGGAISVFTQTPSFIPTGNAQVSYGRFNDLLIKGFVSGPLVRDRLAGSVSVFYNKNDDYSLNLVTGERGEGLEESVIRGKLLWTPSDSVSIQLTASYLDRRAENGANGEPYNGNSATRFVPGAIMPTKPWQIARDGDVFVDVQSTNISLKGVFDFSAGSLTSLTGYQNTDYRVVIDADWVRDNLSPQKFVSDLTTPQETISQELVFASREYGRFSYVSGLFLYKSTSGFQPFVSNNTNYILQDKLAEAWAVFGEANYEVTDKLSVILGARYSSEKQETNRALGVGALPPVVPDMEGDDWQSFTPRVSVSYALNERSNLYFTYSQGFKSGGLSLITDSAHSSVINGVFVIPFVVRPYEPEKISAYEVGVKGRYFDVLTLNVAAYYYDYTDQQVSSVVQQAGASIATVTNASASTIKGLDVEGTWRVTGDFTLSGGLSVLDAKFDEFLAQVLQPVIVNGVPAGNVGVTKDVSGNRMIRAPKWTLNLAANYDLHLSGGDLSLNASLYHSDTVFYDVINRVKQAPYTTYNASASWRPSASNWTLTAWGRNLSNEPVLSGLFQHEGGDGVSYAPPRTYGVSVGYAF